MPDQSIIPFDVTRYSWGRRMFDPHAPFIQNLDGTRSTHRMAAEIDDNGRWWAFPTITQMPNGQLKQFSNNFAAMRWNIAHGEAVPFMSDKNRALWFAAGGYKQGSPLEEKSFIPSTYAR